MIARFLFFGCTGFLLILSCKKKPNQVIQQEDVTVLFDDYQQFRLQINPIEATKAGYTAFNDTIANYISDSYKDHLKTAYDQFLDRIAAVDTTTLGSTQKLALAVMDWECRIKKEGVQNPMASIASPMYNLPTLQAFPLGQIQSLHLYVAQLAGGSSVHPFQTAKDYEDWLKRIEDYLQFLDTSIAKMREGIQTGIVLPKSLVVKMIPQLEDFVISNVEQHLFFQPIVHLPEDLDTMEKKRLKELYSITIKERLIPKYQELKQFLEEEYLPVARTSSGIGALPNGKATYDYLIRLHTSTLMSADEIHQLGLDEVERITREMERAKEEIGFKGDLKAFFNHVRNEPKLIPYSQPEQVIEHFESIESRISGPMATVFKDKPKAGFEVRRTEAFREASASAEYVPGSKDGKRPGVFYVPIPSVVQFNILTSEALFLHEAIPGHHYQLSLQQENEELPAFLHPESLGVFVEGWALYAESLGKELGIYKDPYQYFGMLSMEMHRAIRLVVDTGIHAKGWTREDAIAYSLDNEADSEEGITAEIERYMATPGQALSYKIGQLKIQELRNRAAEQLGPSFDVREFHDQVLNSGSLPLVLLERKIENWIKTQSK